MQALDDALWDRLANDVVLAGLIGTYREGPAIFTEVPLPEGVPQRYVTVLPPDVDVPGPMDTKTTWGRQVERFIGCYQEANGDSGPVDAMAERVRALLHRQPFTVPGIRNQIVSVGNVGRAPTDNTVYGRLMVLTVTFSYR